MIDKSEKPTEAEFEEMLGPDPQMADDIPNSEGPSKPAAGGYEVGYGKPPKKHQFKKGKSGNVKGRPKKPKPDASLALALLNAPVPVNQGGKQVKMQPFEVSLRKLVEKALKKQDFRSAIAFVEYCEQFDVLAKPDFSFLHGVIIEGSEDHQKNLAFHQARREMAEQQAANDD